MTPEATRREGCRRGRDAASCGEIRPDASSDGFREAENVTVIMDWSTQGAYNRSLATEGGYVGPVPSGRVCGGGSMMRSRRHLWAPWTGIAAAGVVLIATTRAHGYIDPGTTQTVFTAFPFLATIIGALAVAFRDYEPLGTRHIQLFEAKKPRPTRLRAYASPNTSPRTAQGSLPARAGSPLAGRVSHPLDDERSFMAASQPPFSFDQPCLVAP